MLGLHRQINTFTNCLVNHSITKSVSFVAILILLLFYFTNIVVAANSVGSLIEDNTTYSNQNPQSKAKQTVVTVCLASNSDQGELNDQRDLGERCNDIDVADGIEIEPAYNNTRVSVAAQSRLGSNIMIQQLGSIARRLASLRDGIYSTGSEQLYFHNLSASERYGGSRGIAIAESSLNMGGEQFSIHSLSASGRYGRGAGGKSKLSSNLGLFASGNFAFGKKEETIQEDSTGFHTYNVVVGVNYRLNPKLIFGSALDYAGTGLDPSDSSGSFNNSSVNLVAYTTYSALDKLYLDAIVTLKNSAFNFTRHIVGNNISNTAMRHNNQVFASSIGGGYEMLTSKSLLLFFTGRINYLYANVGEFEETGAADFNIAVHEQAVDSFITSFGMQLNHVANFSWGEVVPQLYLNWEHNYLGGATSIEGHFMNDASQTPFSFEADNADDDYFVLGFGATIVRARVASGFIHYETSLGQKDLSGYSVALGGRLKF